MQIKAPYMFDLEYELLCTKFSGIWPHFTVQGKSHVFSLVAAGTWGIFSRYFGGDPSKLVFVQ